MIQPVDFTTLMAIERELRASWLPARLEQVYQSDRHTLSLALRTVDKRDWLTISWHPQSARIGIGAPPPRTPDTFTLSEQLRHQLKGLALSEIKAIAPWERVLDLQFTVRPGESPLWHLYLEIMGKYSNLILTDRDYKIITLAHQVNSQQSRVRTLQTGQPYSPPPPPLGYLPNPLEPLESWRERVSLIPGAIHQQLLKTYRGLSPKVVSLMLESLGIDPQTPTESLPEQDWLKLFQSWQEWLRILATGEFSPGWTKTGYTVLPWGIVKPEKNSQILVHLYYTERDNEQKFQQLSHQLTQKVNNLLKKVRQKGSSFRDRLAQSEQAETYRHQADLLMTYLHQWQPGLKSITLNDLTTDEPVTISLNPEKNAVQNAQILYKQHQKLKRAAAAVLPLLEAVEAEQNYLEQVAATLAILTPSNPKDDLFTLEEIREELTQQGYLEGGKERGKNLNQDSQPDRYESPSGFEVLVGRNNRQNDRLTFRQAGDYDLWFHVQEIGGSHVLLRPEAGKIPEESDLQFAANLAAYYSQGRESDLLPVIYTQPKHVYKPKGAKPGMVVYKHETVIWGRSFMAKEYLRTVRQRYSGYK